MQMSASDSLRQQVKWIREALDPSTPRSQRIGLEDVDVEEIEAAGDELDELHAQRDALNGDVTKMGQEIERLSAQVEFLAGRVRNAHTLLEHDEDHKAMVLLAETWLEHKASFTSTDSQP
jgi:uncharacterized protein (DUF3084 family)